MASVYNFSTITFLTICVIFYCCMGIAAQYFEDRKTLVWCTTRDLETSKCENFSSAVQSERGLQFDVKCKQAYDKDKCMNLIDNQEADITSLDPGELVAGGRYHSLVPIMAEEYGKDGKNGYYAVAVVLSGSEIETLEDLKGRKACFSGVGHLAGWIIPMTTLLEQDVIKVEDCNNMVKTAATFFGPSCAPYSLIDKHNPTGDNPPKMCELCNGTMGNRCSGSDPFTGFNGAFMCLLSGGEVAFLKHTTVEEITSKRKYTGPAARSFRLLCSRGGTTSIDRYQSCNWGFVKSHALVVSSMVIPERREEIQNFLKVVSKKFGNPRLQIRPDYMAYNSTLKTTFSDDELEVGNSLNEKHFHLFSIDRDYANHSNLMFQDGTSGLASIESSDQTYKGYLGKYEMYFKKVQKCQAPNAKLCVVSDKEMEKCIKMRTAFKAQNLKPDLTCIKGLTAMTCMAMIKEGLADLTVLDAGDIYIAGRKFGLIPIVAEQYNLDDPSYYVVAVAKQSDKLTDLLYLKGKSSCHTGVGHAAGWVVPISFLLANDRMRSYGCDSVRAAAEFFQKSCAPGALSKEYSRASWMYGNLCDLCHGVSSQFCARDSSEPFYGHTGAFRCLIEGGGEIAFIKHTTIFENTGGRNPQWWARNMIPDDFELLCRDGSRASHNDYHQCNLARVAANAMVTSSNRPERIINTYIDLFMYAQQFYGSKYSEDYTFKMFVSESDFRDLIFQDATQLLTVVPPEKRNYKEYLGYSFLQAMKLVDCTAGVERLDSVPWIILIFTSLSVFLIS